MYIASKRAVARYVRRMAQSEPWASAGITLNAVAPGVIDTPMASFLLHTSQKRASVTDGRPMPLRSWGEPEHVASLLAWLTSTENGFVTGQIIFADGGFDAVMRG